MSHSLRYGSVESDTESEGFASLKDEPQLIQSEKRNLRPWYALAIGVLALFALVGSISFSTQPHSANNLIEWDLSDIDMTELNATQFAESMALSNAENMTLRRVGYPILGYFMPNRSDVKTYRFLKDYDSLVEPYSTMELAYNQDTSDTEQVHYSYKVLGRSLEEKASGKFYPFDSEKSDTFSVDCEAYDNIVVLLIKYDNGDEAGRYIMKGVCMYVRREIRDIPSDDLNAALDAMYEIWTTRNSQGQDKYGENYHGIDFFAGLHDFNAAWSDSDHIHEGLGFLPQHIKMTNMFEIAMQSVDPSVSLFYWDFTIDVAQGLTIFESPVFTDEVFGTLQQPVDDVWGWTYRNDSLKSVEISDSRWQGILAEVNQYDDLNNGFGFMRGPWNMNPCRKIVRFPSSSADLPGCFAYYSWLETTDFLDFLKTSPYAPHAAAHGAIGGVYGCDAMDSMRLQGYLKDEDSQRSMCAKWGIFIKEWYRGNYLQGRDSCSASVDLETIDCGFVCNEDLKDEMIEMMKSEISMSDFVPEDMDDDGWEAWREFICDGDGYRIFVGDHLESASPSDPSFWPIHPTQDRLFQLKYLTNSFENYTWPSTTSKTGEFVCQHSKCYLSPDDTEKDYFHSCCYGHFEFDQLMDFVSGNRSQGYGPTNHEIIVDSHAGSLAYNMPYIYDDFEFEHCTTYNYDELIDKLASEYLV